MPDETLLICSERTDDERAIFDLHAAAFPTDAEARLVTALRLSEKLEVSLVAQRHAAIIGHVGFSPVTIALPESAASSPTPSVLGLGLAPVAILPDYQRQGIGAALIRHGIDECRKRDVGFIVVLGAPDYYGRFGFEPASKWNLHDEFGGGDAFQAMELRPGAISDTAPSGGLVKYAEEFAAFA